MAGKQLDMNPWKTIWVEPRKTIRAVVRTDALKHFWLLAWIYAFPILLRMAQNMSLGERFPIALIVVAAAILAAFVGWVSLSIFAYVLLWTGRWVGGKASVTDLKATVAWANVPNVINTFLWVILAAEFGGILFTQGFSNIEFTGYQLALVTGVFLAQLVVAIWTFVILLKMIAEVQGFSGWKALFNLLVPVLVVIGASWVVTWIKV